MMNDSVISLRVDTTTMKDISKNSQLVQRKFLEIRKNYELTLCSDASYKDGIASVGITDEVESWLYRVDNHVGSTTAELHGVMQALRLALATRHPRSLLIGCDSKTILDSFWNARQKGRTIQNTVAINFALSWFYEPCEVTLMWIPGHKGIRSNEMADENACCARQLSEENLLSFPTALWSKDSRWKKRKPWDLLFIPDHSNLARHRDADAILEEIKLNQSMLNCDKGVVEGYPQFSYCELCSTGNGTVGEPQTAEHVFFNCPALDGVRSKLRTQFAMYGIPFEKENILDGYCIEETANFLERLQQLKNEHVS